ncbi:hypothetical protein DFS34DRAFT_352897 [Phlyctochytrium arcticum]|nr:hypothetical protein DFS34DRAFT_352897 [Phlyctochytrium arcticum]
MRHRAGDKITIGKLKELVGAAAAASSSSGPSAGGDGLGPGGVIASLGLGANLTSAGGPATSLGMGSSGPASGSALSMGGHVGLGARGTRTPSRNSPQRNRDVINKTLNGSGYASRAGHASSSSDDDDDSDWETYHEGGGPSESLPHGITLSSQYYQYQQQHSARSSSPPVIPEWKVIDASAVRQETPGVTSYSYDLRNSVANGGLSGLSCSEPVAESLGARLWNLADDLDRNVENFFLKLKVLDLIGLWLIMTILDIWVSLPARVEWIGFSIFSLASLRKAWYLSSKVFMSVCMIILCLDASLVSSMRHHPTALVVPLMANVVVYWLIGRVRGFDAASWCLFTLFIFLDYCTKGPPVKEMDMILGSHTVGHGVYILLGELVTTAIDTRTERNAAQNVVYGELRTYPTLKPSGGASKWIKDGGIELAALNNTVPTLAPEVQQVSTKTFYPRIQRNFFNACRQRNVLAAMAAASSGVVSKGGGTASDHSQDQQQQQKPPPAVVHNEGQGEYLKSFYYSNHYELHSRFELCVWEIGEEYVTLGWSLPQSLIVTLCSLNNSDPARFKHDNPVHHSRHSHNKTKLNHVPQSGHATHLTGPVAPPPPVSAASSPENFVTPTLPIANATAAALTAGIVGHATSQLSLPPVLPQSGSTTLLGKDVEVMVNLSYWEDLTVSMPEGVVLVRGLQSNTEYDIVMSIKGYWSTPIRICTQDWQKSRDWTSSGSHHRVRTRTASFGSTLSEENGEATPNLAHLPITIRIAEKSEELRLCFQELDELLDDKRLLLADVKRHRKDMSRTGLMMRTELELLRKMLHKDQQLDVRLRQRIQGTEEALTRLTEKYREKEQDLAVAYTEKKELDDELRLVEEKLTQVKHQLRDLKKPIKDDQGLAGGMSNQQMENLSHELDIKLEDLSRQLTLCTDKVKEAQNELKALEDELGHAALQQERATEISDEIQQRLYEEGVTWRNACLGLKKRSEALEQVLEEEKHLSARLMAEWESTQWPSSFAEKPDYGDSVWAATTNNDWNMGAMDDHRRQLTSSPLGLTVNIPGLLDTSLTTPTTSSTAARPLSSHRSAPSLDGWYSQLGRGGSSQQREYGREPLRALDGRGGSLGPGIPSRVSPQSDLVSPASSVSPLPRGSNLTDSSTIRPDYSLLSVADLSPSLISTSTTPHLSHLPLQPSPLGDTATHFPYHRHHHHHHHAMPICTKDLAADQNTFYAAAGSGSGSDNTDLDLGKDADEILVSLGLGDSGE